MGNPFATASMAEGYARSRPPLHASILKRASALAGGEALVPVALDLGCGSGLSTQPLHRLAQCVIGVEPVREMLIWAHSVAPAAHFLAARAEALPIRSRSVDLITAAGSLNYTDPGKAFREAARVLRPLGAMWVYDFSQGRAFRLSAALGAWFAEFVGRYPPPVNEAIPLDPEILTRMDTGFRVTAHDRFEIGLPMTLRSYVDYLMTEANVACAMRTALPNPRFGSGWPTRSIPSSPVVATKCCLGYIVCLRR